MKITVTQVTEIEVADEHVNGLIDGLNWYKKNGVRLNIATLNRFDATVTNFETHITDENAALGILNTFQQPLATSETIISDLDKSGEI